MTKTTDECVAQAEAWLVEADAWRARTGGVTIEDRARMIAACADAAAAWIRLAEVPTLRAAFPAAGSGDDVEGAVSA